MLKFDLFGTQAQDDAMSSNSEYGVLVVKNDIPQLLIPIPYEDIDDWGSLIRIDPNHIDEISKTTKVYSGTIQDCIFTVDNTLF